MSPIGLRVGPFEIVEEAHVPAHGSWYRAHRAGHSRRDPATVLVRLLGPSPSSRDLGQVQQQFEALRSVDDPRFPSAVALYEGSGALAVDAPHAVPVDRIIQARLLGDVAMTPATLIDLGLELAEALHAAHQRGHHHGHLSADSVALDASGGLWVWGLGLSEDRPTFAWLPPERARGERATAATDQWSLGALLVALVSGQTPWSTSSASADPRSGDLGDFIHPVATQWPALGRLVRRMLDPNPEQRFPSLHPVRLELLGLARRAGGVSERRNLAAWLHHAWALDHGEAEPAPLPDSALDAEPELGDLAAEPHAAQPAPPPAHAAVATPADPVHSAATVHSSSQAPRDLEPASSEPRVEQAARIQASPGRRSTGPLASEQLDVVRPAVDANSVPVANSPSNTAYTAPVQVRLGASPRAAEPQGPDTAADDQPTEMAEDAIATEMYGEDLFDDEPSIPPVRRRISPTDPSAPTDRTAPPRAERPSLSPLTIQLSDEHPARLPPADAPRALTPAEPPAWREEPAPTLPGMELPEPANVTVKPRSTPVQVELELEDDAIEPADIQILADEDQTGPVWESANGRPTLHPFTDPHFGSAALPETPPPAPARPSVATVPPGFERDDAPATPIATAELAFDLDDEFDFDGPQPMPWEREPRYVLPEPANEPIVRVAPWLASAAMAGLVLLTVVNVIRLW